MVVAPRKTIGAVPTTLKKVGTSAKLAATWQINGLPPKSGDTTFTTTSATVNGHKNTKTGAD